MYVFECGVCDPRALTDSRQALITPHTGRQQRSVQRGQLVTCNHVAPNSCSPIPHGILNRIEMDGRRGTHRPSPCSQGCVLFPLVRSATERCAWPFLENQKQKKPPELSTLPSREQTCGAITSLFLPMEPVPSQSPSSTPLGVPHSLPVPCWKGVHPWVVAYACPFILFEPAKA